MTARTLTLWIFLAAVLVPLIATLVIGLLDRSYARAPKHTPPRQADPDPRAAHCARCRPAPPRLTHERALRPRDPSKGPNVMTRLASALPKGEGNGLVSIARALIDSPHDIHVVVALVDCKKTTTDYDSGDVEPTARIRRIEAIGDDDKDLAAKMLRRALEKRTGKTVLPFDLEEDLRAAFGSFDPKTGEIFGDDSP